MRPEKRRASIDGFVHRSAQPLAPRSARPKPLLQPQVPAPANTRRTVPAPAPAPQPRARRAYAKPQVAVRPTIWERLQLPLVILGGIVIGFFMQSLAFGIALIALYGALAVICKVQSRVTFVLSFLSLVATVLLLVVKRNPEQSGNFATYTFLLLVVAVISLIIESRIAKPHYKKR